MNIHGAGGNLAPDYFPRRSHSDLIAKIEVLEMNNVLKKKRVVDSVGIPASASTFNMLTFGSSAGLRPHGTWRTSSCTLPWLTSIIVSHVSFSTRSSARSKPELCLCPTKNILKPATGLP